MDVPSLTLHTILLVRTLPSGNVVTAPVSALASASYGPAGHCADEQQLYLGELLARERPEGVARFQVPEAARLVDTEVIVPREDLPRRLKMRVPLQVHAVVIPDARGQWVTVACLDHTFYVPRDESVEEAVKAEVVRLAGARELSPTQYLELLPPVDAELVPLTLSIERLDRLPTDRVATLRKTLRERERAQWAREVLATVAEPLHEKLPREAPPLASRDLALEQLTALLDGPRRRSVLITGPSLAGKTALVHAWIRARLARVKVTVWATSGTQLIAGMSGLGQWEERVRRVMEAAEAIDAVLYFDNLGDLVSERAHGHADIPSALKPWIEEGRVRVVAELRAELADAAERNHGALLATLARLRVDALSPAAAREALTRRARWHDVHDGDAPQVAPRGLDAVVDLADRYLPYESFPGKAVRLYDDLRALAAAQPSTTRTGRVEVGSPEVYSFFSLQSGIPLFLLREDTALRLDDVVRTLRERVVGQDDAVRRVAETVCVVKARLQPTGKPLATLMFVGPTGVGKTELARGLATLLFGAEGRMVRFDMSEFTDVEAADRLIRGTGGAEGLLTRRVREQPFGVVLLDEIEKAHPSVFDLLLQVCGDARLTDARGRTAWFHNTILIMTSNLGVSSLRDAAGFAQPEATAASHFQRVVERHFRPEFVNRIDRVVPFAPLTAEEILRVARIALDRIAARRGFTSAGITLRVWDGALAALARDGYSARYGARALRRHLEDHLVAPVARLLSAAPINGAQGAVTVTLPAEDVGAPEGMTLVHELAAGALAFKVFVARATDARESSNAFERITTHRRNISRAMRYPRVEALQEQLEFLVLQLDHGRAAGARHAGDVAGLGAQHHRLDAVWRSLASHLDDILVAEELAIDSFLHDRVPHELVAEADTVWERFERDLARALIAQEPYRDTVTLLLSELDGHRTLDRWLPPLADACERRGWTALAHIDGEPPRADEAWPRERRWGVGRALNDQLERVTAPARTARNVLLRVRGEGAGALLALEAGLQVWPAGGEEKDACLDVTLVKMATELSDKDWEHPALVPCTPGSYGERRRARRNREHASTGWVRTRDSRWAGPFGGLHAYFEALERVAAQDLVAYELNEMTPRDERFIGLLDEQVPESMRG